MGRAPVRTYRRLWLCWWTSLGALGVLMGLATVPVLALVGVFLTAGIVAGAVAVLPVALDDQHVSTRALIRPALRRGLQGALVVVTVVVSSTSLGSLVVPLLVLVALSSPWTLRWCMRLLGLPQVRGTPEQRPAPDPGPAADREEPLVSDWAPAIRALSDEELCWSWRASYPALLAAPAAASLELVTLRQAYLEDLERRNPRGMRAWLDSGARAAGNPAPYLAPDTHRRLRSQSVAARIGPCSSRSQERAELRAAFGPRPSDGGMTRPAST